MMAQLQSRAVYASRLRACANDPQFASTLPEPVRWALLTLAETLEVFAGQAGGLVRDTEESLVAAVRLFA